MTLFTPPQGPRRNDANPGSPAVGLGTQVPAAPEATAPANNADTADKAQRHVIRLPGSRVTLTKRVWPFTAS